MKPSKFLVLVINFMSMCISSSAQGVIFFKADNWKAVLSKASAEHKYIFVDGYATWCKPCKMMDSNIYVNKHIGSLVNDKFISVKIQVDQNDNDDSFVKSWYYEAEQIAKRYKMTAFPTLLFLSADGDLLYRAEGYRDLSGFEGLVNFATDPKSQEFRPMVEAYKIGKRNYPMMPQLIKQVAEVLKEDSLARTMTRDYFKNYLDKQTATNKVLTNENMWLALAFQSELSSSSNFVSVLKKYPSSYTDSLMNWPGATLALLKDWVLKEELEKKLWNNDKVVNKDPDWKRMEKAIAREYPEVNAKALIKTYCQYGVSALQVEGFYYRTGNWQKFNQLFEDDVKLLFEKRDYESINNIGWWIYFCTVTDRKSLECALTWMNTLVALAETDTATTTDNLTAWIDTKAALQYKLGYRKMALETERKDLEVMQLYNKKNNIKINNGCGGFLKTIELMEKGEKLGSGYVSIPVKYPKKWKLLD